jgi:hypothetical protein
MEHHNVEEVNHGTKWAMASIAMLICREKTSMNNYVDSRVSNLTNPDSRR